MSCLTACLEKQILWEANFMRIFGWHWGSQKTDLQKIWTNSIVGKIEYGRYLSGSPIFLLFLSFFCPCFTHRHVILHPTWKKTQKLYQQRMQCSGWSWSLCHFLLCSQPYYTTGIVGLGITNLLYRSGVKNLQFWGITGMSMTQIMIIKQW